MKRVKSDEESISRIFINDLRREKSRLVKKFYARARKLGDSKAIPRETQHWLEYKAHEL